MYLFGLHIYEKEKGKGNLGRGNSEVRGVVTVLLRKICAMRRFSNIKLGMEMNVGTGLT